MCRKIQHPPVAIAALRERPGSLGGLLQGSLGGNSFTTLLCCVHPGEDNYEESLQTLCFADRCKNTENRPVVNYVDPERYAL